MNRLCILSQQISRVLCVSDESGWCCTPSLPRWSLKLKLNGVNAGNTDCEAIEVTLVHAGDFPAQDLHGFYQFRGSGGRMII